MNGKKIVLSYRDLEVWKRAMAAVTEVYRLTEMLPSSERFGLQIQIRRAAVSIPSNIAEGQARSSSKEFAHFISIALGSMAELNTQLAISRNLGWLSEEALSGLQDELDQIGRMLRGLQRSISGAKLGSSELATNH